MNEYFPTVVQVIPLDNYHVQVFFDDGKIVDYDTTQDLKSSIFEPLRDIENFKNACTVMNGTLAWDISGKMDESDCIDIDPFTLYELKAINSLIRKIRTIFTYHSLTILFNSVNQFIWIIRLCR